MPSAFTLDVVSETGKMFASNLKRQLRAARQQLRAPLREMSLVLVNDSSMSDLHQRHMNRPGPTDVLTFPIELDRRGKPLAGEVYVCVPEARRAAKEHGTRVADEVLLYALHGMLHLCGLDDRTPAEFTRMHRTEDRILGRIGVGPVFDPHKSRDARDTRRPTSPTRLTRRASASAERGERRASRASGAARKGARR